MAPPARFLCDQCATAHGSMQTRTSTLECSWQIEILTPVSSYFTRTKSNTTNTLWHKSLYIWFLQLKLCKPLQLQHYLYPILYQHRTTHGIINLERKMLCKQDAVSTPHSPLQTMVLHAGKSKNHKGRTFLHAGKSKNTCQLGSSYIWKFFRS